MSPAEGVEDPRLEQLVDGIVRLAAGELDARIEPSDQRDAIDAVITGVNLLAEELGHIYTDLRNAWPLERPCCVERRWSWSIWPRPTP